MRKSIFRGKSVEDGRWVYGGLLFVRDSCYILHSPEMPPVEVDPVTTGECMDCLDEAVRVFEGDAIHIWGGHPDERGWEVDFVTVVRDIRYDYADLYHAEGVEVVGNIHDTPEMDLLHPSAR